VEASQVKITHIYSKKFLVLGWEQNGGGAKPWEQNGGGQAPE
jgi:hypothetical protein